MGAIAERRELMEATQALVKTNAPTAEHYDRLMAALSAVATHDIGRPIKAVLAIPRNARDELNLSAMEAT
ncbi:hypothetical protein E5S69_32200 [Cupriavidus necator]|uniref:hypothetical protein n=1 Tax=Cupriavidus necator TaxID=106590 RepID=UPI0014903CDE|nr:hypothetical protein [Cupriavidus necator]NOV28147.1 hypothetical protein [Cupriavidus necator]